MALSGAACAAILGFEDGALDPGLADGGPGNGASGEAGLGGEGGAGGPDGTAPGGGDCSNCLGAGCDDAGRCAPILLAPLDHPLSLAVGPDALYVVHYADTVARVAKSGGGETSMAGAEVSAGGLPQRVVTAAGVVYWSAYASGVYRCPAGGCPDAGPTGISMDENGPIGIGVNGGRLAWTDRISAEIVVADEGNGAARVAVLAPGVPAELTTDSTYAYVTETSPSDVVRVRLDDGGLTTVGSVPAEPVGVVVANGTAYVALRSRGMYALPLGGGAGKEFGAKTKSAHAVATDGTSLYWTDEGDLDDGGTFAPGTSCIWTCPLATCTSAAATAVVCGLDDANGIGVDDAAIYWIEFGTGDPGNATGHLQKIGKPR